MTPRRLLAPLCLAILPGCRETGQGAGATPAPVMQLAFEDSCRPEAVAELELAVSPSGISFETGIEGRAVRLEDAAVRLGGLERLGLSDSMTLEFFVNLADWHNPYGEGTVKNLISHADDFAVAVRGWALEARVTTAGAGRAQRLSGDSFAPDSWHHVALVLDGAQGQARLVLDGRDIARTSASGKLVIDPAFELVVGTWREQEETFTGLLDSVRLWSRALTADELRARAALLDGAGAASKVRN